MREEAGGEFLLLLSGAGRGGLVPGEELWCRERRSGAGRGVTLLAGEEVWCRAGERRQTAGRERPLLRSPPPRMATLPTTLTFTTIYPTDLQIQTV